MRLCTIHSKSLTMHLFFIRNSGLGLVALNVSLKSFLLLQPEEWCILNSIAYKVVIDNIYIEVLDTKKAG